LRKKIGYKTKDRTYALLRKFCRDGVLKSSPYDPVTKKRIYQWTLSDLFNLPEEDDTIPF